MRASFVVGLLVTVVSPLAWATLVTTGREATVIEEPAEMIRIPGGTFFMGASEDERKALTEACIAELGIETARFVCDENNVFYRSFRADGETCDDEGRCGRLVHVYDFDIDRTEVTTRAYRRCVEDGVCSATPLVAGDLRYIQDEWPIVNVTWDEADEYCAWRGARLPTEAEWEKAARGTDARRWPWGNQDSTDRANRGTVEDEAVRGFNVNYEPTVDETDGSKLLAPPGKHKWGKSPYGVEDMAGNASEWVADHFDDAGYKGMTTIDPRGAKNKIHRAVRGGSFFEPRLFARTYVRWGYVPDARAVDRGFRCARSGYP